MFSQFKNALSANVLRAMVLGGACVCSSVQSVAAATPSDLLVGTWGLKISLTNCKTGAPLGEPFISLLTFDAGGTMTETTSNPHFYPAVRGPGHGVWSYVGGRTFRASTLALITNDGVLTELQTIRQQIDISADARSLATPIATVSFAKPDGTPIANGCAIAVGKRLE